MPSTQLVSCLVLMLVACGVENEPSPIEDSEPEPIDQDGDGVLEADDCDDQDPMLGAQSLDGDCDGVSTLNDCDDNDPAATSRAEDGDCDGALTADDCDDSDPESHIRAEDGDCDGALTADDCDDSDPESHIRAEDGDCDGVLTADDCDDADPDSSIVADDSDCDGFVNASDCLPEDPAAPRSAVWTVVESHSLATAPATANWCDGAWGGQGPAEVGGRAAWLMSSDWNSLWVSLPFSETDSMLAIQADMHLGEGSRSGALAAMIDPNGVCHLSNHGVNLSYSNERCAEGARNCLRVTGAESGVVHEGDSTGLFNDWITFRWEIFRDDGLVQLRVDGELETCFYATEAELAGSHMKFNANTSCCSLQPDLGASDLMFETGQ